MPRSRAEPAPVASYRFQLTPDRGFDAACRVLDRLVALGVSHLYLSPVTEAVPGSTHGYDVVDHAQVRSELGGLDGLTALLDALAGRSMAAVVDHVPNHAAVAVAEHHRHWWTLLREGPGSPADRWFDVDWAAADNRVLLPLLDRPLGELVRAGSVRLGRDERGDPVLVVADLRLPMAPGTEPLPVDEALERQHWRLIEWRRPERNVRRFFTIDGLAALRVEHEEVAAEVDTVPRLLLDHPGFGGLRVDHVDGLADPLSYLGGLRELLGERWLVVEKILAPGEILPPHWPVDGTTGYEHARVLEHALLDPDGWERIMSRWSVTVGDARPFREWELDARREVLDGGLRPDRDRVARVAVAAVDGASVADATGAVTELSAHLERYRTYLPDDDDGRRAGEDAVAASVGRRPDLAAPIKALWAAIDGAGGPVAVALRTRWQQLTGPAAAKGVEDRAFWRYVPLASLGEVGGHPAASGDGDAIAALHRHHADTAARWPKTMNAGTTHDVARSEDVRAHGLALAAAGEAWIRVFDEWSTQAAFPDVDAAVQWHALQTVATTPGLTAARLEAYLVKAAREAAQHTSWTEPDPDYEQRLAALAEDALAWPPVAELAASIDRRGRALTLALLAARLTAPGVPDVYQGTEAFRFLLVDPDNRTPPDETELDELVARAAAVDGPTSWAEPRAESARAVVLGRVLAVRRRYPAAFGPDGGYAPLSVLGGDRVIAFARLEPDGAPAVVTVVSDRSDTTAIVELPAGEWRHALIDGEPSVSGAVPLGRAMERFPAVVLVRE